MILRPGARESNASPILILQTPWLRPKPGDFFVSLESLESLEALESLESLESLDALDALDALESLDALEALESTAQATTLL